MDRDLFFKGEIPALETDKEGKLRGGFCAFSGGEAGFFTDTDGCSNQCGNGVCENKCGNGTGVANDTCTNKCAWNNSDSNNKCTNDCPINSGCSTTNDCKCTPTPDSKSQQGTGFSVFSLGTSALF